MVARERACAPVHQVLEHLCEERVGTQQSHPHCLCQVAGQFTHQPEGGLAGTVDKVLPVSAQQLLARGGDHRQSGSRGPEDDHRQQQLRYHAAGHERELRHGGGGQGETAAERAQ